MYCIDEIWGKYPRKYEDHHLLVNGEGFTKFHWCHVTPIGVPWKMKNANGVCHALLSVVNSL